MQLHNSLSLTIKNIFKKIEVSPYFYISLFFVFFLKIQRIFFITLLFILLHELSHVYIAKKYNLNLQKIIITPLGLIAVINNINSLYLHQRLILISAGVFFNFIMLLLFDTLHIFFNIDYALTLKNVNLSIILFNLLPIFPLDGSKFLLYVLGNLLGDIKALNLISKVSLLFSYLLLLLGVLQVVLVPYNITILCFAIYFITNNSSVTNLLKLDYYKNLYTNTNTYTTNTTNINTSNKILKVKHLMVSPELQLKDLYVYFSSDYYIIFYISITNDSNSVITSILQDDFLTYIQRYPVNTSIGEIINIIQYNSVDE